MYKIKQNEDESIIGFIYDLVFVSIALIIIFLEFIEEKSGISTHIEINEGFFKKLFSSITVIMFILLFKFMRYKVVE